MDQLKPSRSNTAKTLHPIFENDLGNFLTSYIKTIYIKIETIIVWYSSEALSLATWLGTISRMDVDDETTLGTTQKL